MKRIYSLLVLAMFGLQLSAQKNLEKAANETCDCLNKANPSDNISQEEYQKLLTQCLANPINLYYEKICKEIKIESDNSESSYEAVGTKIGLKLVENCPLFMKLAMGNAEAAKTTTTATTLQEETGKTGESKGVIKSVEAKDFNYIHIETASGAKESFIWLRYFQGSAPFENNPTAQVGKKVVIKYRELRCYSPALGDYAIKKEITEILFED